MAGLTGDARRGNGLLILVVLIAVAIVLYLMFGNMGGTSYMEEVKKTKDRGESMAREISTGQMSLLIAMYRQSNGRLPASPGDMESPGAFNDRWGREMSFTFASRGGATIVTYRSGGSDGVLGNDDDETYEDRIPY